MEDLVGILMDQPIGTEGFSKYPLQFKLTRQIEVARVWKALEPDNVREIAIAYCFGSAIRAAVVDNEDFDVFAGEIWKNVPEVRQFVAHTHHSGDVHLAPFSMMR